MLGQWGRLGAPWGLWADHWGLGASLRGWAAPLGLLGTVALAVTGGRGGSDAWGASYRQGQALAGRGSWGVFKGRDNGGMHGTSLPAWAAPGS